MRILVACEESQRVTKAFRQRGHEAWSCDLLPCSGGYPEWHIQADVLTRLTGWDAIIAFPPCTYLTVAGNAYFNTQKYGDKARQRALNREEAIEFVKQIANAPCEYIAIENPVGALSTRWRKPDQIARPWMFGDPSTKPICLWLKGFPSLKPTKEVTPLRVRRKNGALTDAWMESTGNISNKQERARIRSITFQGVAEAMAEQWSQVLSQQTDKRVAHDQ